MLSRPCFLFLQHALKFNFLQILCCFLELKWFWVHVLCYDSSDGGGARLAEGLDMGQMFNHLDLPWAKPYFWYLCLDELESDSPFVLSKVFLLLSRCWCGCGTALLLPPCGNLMPWHTFRSACASGGELESFAKLFVFLWLILGTINLFYDANNNTQRCRVRRWEQIFCKRDYYC